MYAPDPQKAAALAGKFPKLVESQARPSPDKNLHIVRPDGYVGLTAGANDWDEAEQYLEKLA